MSSFPKSEIEKIVSSRPVLPQSAGLQKKQAEEGGCGVTGFISSIPVKGRHIYEPSIQMHNRGNGKGGGIAAVGLCAEDLEVSQEVLDSHYMLQVALLNPECRRAVEERNIDPLFDVHTAGPLPTVDDYRDVEGLEVRPPDVFRYFVRVKPAVLERFVQENGLQDLTPERAEDEFIYRNSVDLNQTFYASLGEQQAFVLSHARNLMILKIVGYAEKVVQYYRLENFRAHGWIAHQRYPTKGRVWHPGGAHPFSGLDEALVHNGDFANYHAVSEYLKQYRIYPQFLTDTEVSIQLFDLWNRTFGYPLEYIIEAMAPTTEHDFDLLPPDKQHIYRYLQSAHIQASPDGPWLFIIARNNPYEKAFQLLGITDTSMLRPQVFALQDGEVQIGLVCSEKQAIDATLQSLAAEDSRFCPVADIYWNARGGSASDGGAFIFTVKDSPEENGKKVLRCTDKFGHAVTVPADQRHYNATTDVAVADAVIASASVPWAELEKQPDAVRNRAVEHMPAWDFAAVHHFCEALAAGAEKSDAAKAGAIEVLTYLNDRRYGTGRKKRSAVLQMVRETLARIFKAMPGIGDAPDGRYAYVDWSLRGELREPRKDQRVLVLNARAFPPEGEHCDARLICDAYRLGWRQFICFGYKGQRFTGCGLSRDTAGVRIDVYDSSGDYLASGIDGLHMFVHGNAQDQVGQILKQGKLVIYGDVGQTFMYGAKGGEVYVMGNAAGRPLINAVGRPRVVINGTSLDYLAESFMAGNPLDNGGFVILNGMSFDNEGNCVEQATPYPGSNLFSLASGGAIYVRDPRRLVVAEQLNGGEIVNLSPADWALILPFLEENERLFGISVEQDLLTVNGVKEDYRRIYRKVQPAGLAVLAAASMEVEEYGEDWLRDRR